MKVKIDIAGCHASTNISLEVTSEEFKFLQGIEDLINKQISENTCKPNFTVDEHKDITFYCETCKEITNHTDIGNGHDVKCDECGKYEPIQLVD